MGIDVESLTNTLRDNFSGMFSLPDIQDKWNKLGLDIDDERTYVLALMNLVKENVYLHLHLLGFVLTKLKSVSAELADLLVFVAEETNGSYGGLKELAQNLDNPIELTRMMLKTQSHLSGGISGILLGNVYLSKSNVDPSLVIEKLESDNQNEIICGLRAFAIAAPKCSGVAKALEYVTKLAVSEKRVEVLSEVPRALVAAYTDGDTEIIGLLEHLSNIGEDATRLGIIHAIEFDNKIDARIKLRLLSECAETQNQGVHQTIGDCLYGLKDVAEIDDVMNLVLKTMRSAGYYSGGSINWVLGEFGRVKINEIADVVLQELNRTPHQERERWERLTGPDILTDSGRNNLSGLCDILSRWAKEASLRPIVLATSKEMLNQIRHSSNDSTDKVLDCCISYLSEIAAQEGLNPDRIMRSETKKILKCGKLLDAISQEMPEYDFKAARLSLQLFPHIRAFLGDDWILQIERGQKTAGGLLFLLSSCDEDGIKQIQKQIQNEKDDQRKQLLRLQLRGKIRCMALCQHINVLLKNIASTESGIGSMRRKLQGEEFSEGLSELELIGRLRYTHEVICYPSVERKVDGNLGHSDLDALARIDGQEILVEVVTPRMMPELEYLGSAGVPNRLASIVRSEYNEQLSGMTTQRDVVIVLDKSRSEISYDSAEAYMDGPLSMVLEFDEEMKQVVSSYVKRKEEASMSKLAPEMNIILGILVYDRVLGRDGRFHIRGRFCKNPAAMTPEKERIVSRFEKTFTG